MSNFIFSTASIISHNIFFGKMASVKELKMKIEKLIEYFLCYILVALFIKSFFLTIDFLKINKLR